MEKAIEVKNLRRIYKKGREKPFVAIDDISFEVYYGEIFGLLGPNGAGKTTTIKILSTLLYPTEGEAKVGGYDVINDSNKIRSIINLVSGGETAGYGILTLKESLWMFSQFYGIETDEAMRRIEKYLKLVDMWDNRNTLLNKLSTGMMQRVNLVRGLVSEPKILFLDEPTLGLDIEGARIIRKIVRKWVDEDKERAVVLTTHYMAEADELCDRIAIINKGSLVACDTPESLKKSISAETFFEITTPLLDQDGIKLVESMKNSSVNFKHYPEESETVLLLRLKQEKEIAHIIAKLEEHNIEIRSLKRVESTLEDVFINLVGRRFEDEEQD
jgi:ABC-2 type transport system ATP-binding protein